MKWPLISVLALVLALLPSVAVAQGPDDEGDVLLRIGGDVVVGSSETVDVVIVIDGDLLIEGTVEAVFVVEGNVAVSGRVNGDITVVSGKLDLRSSANVGGQVNLVDADLTRAQGATVEGEIHENDDFVVPTNLAAALAVFSILFWLSMTLAIVVAGLVFAAIGGRQLTEASRAMTGSAVNTILGAIFVWVALPILAALVMVTLIGLPLGLGMLFVVLPALWFLGYIAAGTRLGTALVGISGRESGVHPFLATFLGLLLLQLLLLIPGIGVLVAGLAGLWGAGALAYIAYRAAGGKAVSTDRPSEPPPQAQPTA